MNWCSAGDYGLLWVGAHKLNELVLNWGIGVSCRSVPTEVLVEADRLDCTLYILRIIESDFLLVINLLCSCVQFQMINVVNC